MGRLEVACRRFAVLSGVRQEPGNYTSCVLPRGLAGQKRGLLALVTEPAGEHPSLGSDACRLVQDVVTHHYYSHESISLTSGLLKALDAANSALIERNYSDDLRQAAGGNAAPSVAVRAGGIRSRGAQVGLTAVLLRPDGAGIYLAQMAPTQAYMVHNGMLAALPEPRSWHRGAKVAVMLRRVPNPTEEAQDDLEIDGRTETLQPGSLPALPLGSGPSADVDFVYRRVEPGDIVVVVSRSLARHLDKSLMEEILSAGDADGIIDALYNLSTEKGLAESHACVLHLGAEITSGVDMEPVTPSEPGGSAGEEVPALTDAQQVLAAGTILRGPREWFSRLRPTTEDESPPNGAHAPVINLFSRKPAFGGPQDSQVAGATQTPEAKDEQEGGSSADEAHITPSALQPTEVLVHHAPDLPPFKAQEPASPPAVEVEELEFDGWEDTPPIIAGRQSGPGVASLPPWLGEEGHGQMGARPSSAAQTTTSGSLPVPQLFDQSDDDADFLSFLHPATAGPVGFQEQELPAPPQAAAGPDLKQQVTDTVAQLGSRLKTLSVQSRGSIAVGGGRGVAVPYRVLIVAGVVVLGGLLAFSVLRGASNPRQSEAATLIVQAKQDETLGNQPSTSKEERLAHLQSALAAGQKALTDDPASVEAPAIIGQVQSDIDTLQGITRVEPNLLFDTSGADKAQAGESDGVAAAPVTTTGQLSGMVIQGNDAYLLDKERGKVFRCKIASRECTVVLQSGDTAGGQKVGKLAAFTSRVGNPVVLDSNMVAYVYATDTSTWQAQPLGGAEGLSNPKDFATYDGNLYLLSAKPGQISKYSAGHYGEGPEDWIKDGASSDQVKDALAFAIDGAIYTLLPNGKIVVMQGGKATSTLSPQLPEGSGPPAGLLTSADLQGIYLWYGTPATVVRLSKEGQLISTLKPAKESPASISGITVDEGRGKIYLLQGSNVYEAGLISKGSGPAASPSQQTPSTQPAPTGGPAQPQPTAEP